MVAKLFRWLRLGLNDDQRQNLTTFSMMFGTMSLTLLTGVMIWMQRYSWPAAVIAQHAGALIDGFFWVIFGLLGLMGVMIIAQAVIAIGGKMRASIGAASIEAESHDK